MAAGPASRSVRFGRLQAIAFLLVFPALNTTLAVSILHNLGVEGPGAPLNAGMRMWATFAASLVLLRGLKAAWPWALDDDAFWRQLLVHIIIVASMGLLFGPFIEIPPSLPRPRLVFAPRIVLSLQLATYLVVVRILRQQARWAATTVALRDAELNVLRSRSNPHFLFNTLHLVASEVSRDPDNAKEIIFDLADLLRSSVKAADCNLSSVGDELELVRLYLQIQAQRFRDRLTFSMDIAPVTSSLEIPSLLLQPIVENTVKWAVAPHPGQAHIRVACELQGKVVSIVFQDTGPAFHDGRVSEGEGLRILRRTLELHYPPMGVRPALDTRRWSLRAPISRAGVRAVVSEKTRVRKRVVIIDDEPAAIANLCAVLDEFDELEVVAEVRDGQSAIAALRHHRPDLVFLDIEMPGVSGLEVAARTSDLHHQLVFVTAYDQYALEAFGTHAIDYLLKPVRPSVLRGCIEKILRQEEVVARVLWKREARSEGLVIAEGGDVRALSFEHVSLVEGLGRYRRLHLTRLGVEVHGTSTIVSDTTLDELETQLPTADFMRIHRSYIVALKEVTELSLQARRYFVKLANVDLEVPVSRSKVADLRARLR